MSWITFVYLFLANFAADAVSKRAIDERPGSRLTAYFGVLILGLPWALGLSRKESPEDPIMQGATIALGLLCLLYAFRK